MARILHLEDDIRDHKLIRATLAEDGGTFEIDRVDSEAAFREKLAEACTDLILADYNLGGFDGVVALGIARESCPDVPFIIVSGAMGDIAVADILRAGATDFVLKDHLGRLMPAIRRALREAEERRARHAAEMAMREAKEAAESANRAKDRFLAMLSHELRTPLSPVVMALGAMHADPDLPAKFFADLAMVRRNIDLEVALIDDLLDLSRVMAGKLRLREAATSVHTLIAHVAESTAGEIAAKHLTLKLEPEANADTVLGDSARLQQAIWNVLRNAAKFTPVHGSITVRTSNPSPAVVRVQITDTGRGIEKDALPKLFEPFEQVSSDITRDFGGLGMGLAIVRSVIELHHGRVWAESDGLGHGATFWLELPVAGGAVAATTPATPAPAAASDERPVRVLLVEDHEDTRRMLSRILKASGHDVTIAGSVAQGLETAAKQSFDVVVSDIGLPDGTGNDLMRQLRDTYGLKGIALTGYGMDDDVERGRQAGFVEHLLKPVDFDLLRRAIRMVADLNGSRAS